MNPCFCDFWFFLCCYIHPFGTIYIISEGEEGVRADSHGLQGADPVLLFSCWQRLGHLFKHWLPKCQVWTLSTRRMKIFIHSTYFWIKHGTGAADVWTLDGTINCATFGEVPVAHRNPLTSPMVSLTYWSIALAISARFTPLRNFMFRTHGWCLSHQLSALSPARRVQWIRDCWPAPIPITCRTQARGSVTEKHSI